ITTHNLTDLYVFLADWNGPSQATIRVFVNPLVPLVWLGGLLMLLGGITCWWPERRRRKPPTHLEKQRGRDEGRGRLRRPRRKAHSPPI
ncbi:MAG: hypothetical protein E6I32_01755, partial [Chloroflexi bacterium]